MSREELVEELAKGRVLEKMIAREVKEHRPEHDDLAQDLYISLLGKEESKLLDLLNNDKLEFYLLGMIKKNLHSNTSPFYYTYRRFSCLNNGPESKEYQSATTED